MISSLHIALNAKLRRTIRMLLNGRMAMFASILIPFCACSAQIGPEYESIAFYRPVHIPLPDAMEPGRRNFHEITDGFQPIHMDATALRPFDSSDRSDLTPEHGELNGITPFIDSSIHFDAWMAEIPADGLELLHELAAVLRMNPTVVVRVEGHTDNVGDPTLNVSLSKTRADNIGHELVLHGVDPDQIVTIGYGDRFPIASNAERESRMLNRRAEFRFLVATGH